MITKAVKSICKKISKLKCGTSNKKMAATVMRWNIFPIAMQSLSESLQLIDESPIKMKRLGEGKYPTSKMKETENVLKTKILKIPENINSGAVSQVPVAEIIKQLKEKFHYSSTSENLKVTVLTILPKSWSVQEVQEVF
jgi:hypothetical protein